MIQQFHSLFAIFEKKKLTNLKIHITPIFIAAVFTIAKIWKRPKCPPADEWTLSFIHSTSTCEALTVPCTS